MTYPCLIDHEERAMTLNGITPDAAEGLAIPLHETIVTMRVSGVVRPLTKIWTEAESEAAKFGAVHSLSKKGNSATVLVERKAEMGQKTAGKVVGDDGLEPPTLSV